MRTLRTAEDVADHYRDLIRAGELKSGQRLPPVRSGGDQYGLDPATVSKGYRILVSEGLVTSRQGRGTVVASQDPQDGEGLREAITNLEQMMKRMADTLEAVGVTVRQAQERLGQFSETEAAVPEK